jgi:hypothetical protein
MKPFEYFLNQSDVKKCSPDKELAKSLIKDMSERIEKSLLLDTEVFSKLIFENIYDALRDFCDAILALRGFKSYSHQASIAYLEKENFDFPTIQELDKIRYKRNSSKYYGESISKKDAEEIKEFYLKLKKKINNIIKKEFK